MRKHTLPHKIKIATVVIGLTLLAIFPAGWSMTPPNHAAVQAFGTNGSMQLGVYPQGYITQQVIDSEIHSLDTWAGKKVSIAGITLEIDDPNPQTTFQQQLTPLWNNGLTPFINLKTGYFSQPTAASLASGQYDTAITRWAQAYAAWTATGKWAFIALFPEMNTPWVSYGMDPVNYKAAHNRIQSIFSQNGVPENAVRWVFSVNGWINNNFSAYYPGNEAIDIVGFTALNHGYCPAYSTSRWITPTELFAAPISSLRSLAPTKSIFATSLATSAYFTSGQKSTTAKNQWLNDAYNYLANTLGIQAVIYYNLNNSWECDWATYKLSGDKYTGYTTGVSNQEYDYTSPDELGQINFTLTLYTLNLPAVFNNYQACQSSHPMLLAIYTQEWPGLQTTMDNEAHPMDAWAKKNNSLIGTYIDIEDPNPTANVTGQLERMWENGYTPFVNLSSIRSASQIASGRYDTAIRNWARAFKQYAEEDGGRMAFIAPLQEMNGTWVPYGRDPANYELAYAHIRNLFTQEGVPADSVRWTFAPNGSGDAFEKYYPGDSIVDVVAFSSYNWGYYPSNPYPKWETANQIYLPYMDRMQVMAPTKPIIIAQTATSAYTSTGYNAEAKNQWLRDAYALTSNYSGFLGIIYDNRTDDHGYDFSVYVRTNPTMQFQGYVDAAADQNICYLSPQQLKASDLYQLTIP